MKILLAAFVLIFRFSSYLSSFEYELAVCTIFKNNSPFFREWIEFHRLVGVEHFYLYDNSSTDNPREILEPYIKAGVVTLIDWPDPIRPTKRKLPLNWVKKVQETAYNHCCFSNSLKVRWLAVIDTDEFLIPMLNQNLREYLELNEDHPAVFVWWRVYGTSNVYDIPPGKLMIEMLTKRFPENHVRNLQGKLIVKPKMLKKFNWAGHRGVYRNGLEAYVSNPSDIRINHYFHRTVKFYLEQKVALKEHMDGVKWSNDQIQNHLNEGNDVDDPIMEKFVPAMRKRLESKID